MITGNTIQIIILNTYILYIVRVYREYQSKFVQNNSYIKLYFFIVFINLFTLVI